MIDQYITIEELTQSGYNKLRVRFSKPVPYLVTSILSPWYENSALNPQNYQVQFDDSNTIEDMVVTGVSSVADQYDCVDVEIRNEEAGGVVPPLETGVYKLTVSNVKGSPAYEKTVGDIRFHPEIRYDPTIDARAASEFVYCQFSNPPQPQVGIVAASQEQALRKFLNPILDGPNFRALLAAFAYGESWNADNAEKALQQMFVSRASGAFLDRIASTYGVSRPVDVGMGDQLFREYAVRLYSGKLTEKSFYDILKVFYSTEGVCAYVIQSESSTLGNVVDNTYLTINLDGTVNQTIYLFSDEFSVINPEPEQVAAVVTRKMRNLKMHGYMTVDEQGLLRVYSETKGLRSSVQVSGTALSWIPLPIEKSTLLMRQGIAYVGRDAEGYMRFVMPVISQAVTRNLGNATYLSVGAPETVVDVFSGFSYDPESKIALTDYFSNTTSPISKMSRPGVIQVADSTNFEDGEGYLVIGYGYSYQEGPIPYISAGGGKVYISPQYRFQNAIPSGVDVTKLDGNLGYRIPVNGTFFLTDSNAAWDKCKMTIIEMVAAGEKYKFDFIYPSEPSLPFSSVEYMYAPNPPLPNPAT